MSCCTDRRFATDSQQIEDGFVLLASELREYAEEIAFCMAAEPELGLDPGYRELYDAFARGGRVAMEDFGRAVRALEHLKIARPRRRAGAAEAQDADLGRFSFIHRRIREYFVSCVVLKSPDRISAQAMLTDAHWRETVVTILQLASPSAKQQVLDEMRTLLSEAADESGAEAGAEPGVESGAQAEEFHWPPGALYILEILAAGFGGQPAGIPDDLRDLAGRLLSRAARQGRREDRLWAIDVVLTAPPAVTTEVLVSAFESKSPLLRNAAFRHAGLLSELTSGVRSGIRTTLLAMWATGELLSTAPAVRGQIWRLPDAADLRAAYRLRGGRLRSISPRWLSPIFRRSCSSRSPRLPRQAWF